MSVLPKERKAARQKIEDYHQAKLAELQKFVHDKFNEFYAGKINAFELDHVIHIYHKQSQELFSFVNFYYEKNSHLEEFLDFIEKEEKGERCWEPEVKQE